MGALKIGVFGGTFNPIHLGHLHIACQVQKLFSLSKIYFVVAMMPPHKRPEELIPFTHRFAMVSLATASLSSFIPSLIELEPEASPYSVDTMHKFAGRLGSENGGLYFIAGGDSLMEVNTWRESEKLLNSYNFIFVSRPGTKMQAPAELLTSRTASRVRDLRGLAQSSMGLQIKKEKVKDNRIFIVDIGAPDISATQIRILASSGKSIS